MTEIIEEAREVEGDGPVGIPVKLGLSDERVIQVQIGRSITGILEIVAAERGCLVEELIIVREGEGEPLTELVLIEADYPRHRRHHVHHVSEVTVKVFYQADEKGHPFKRHATVEDVLTWAIKMFKIDATMASEFELALHGTKGELPGTEHIGHLAGRHHELVLDLVRGDIANGAGE